MVLCYLVSISSVEQVKIGHLSAKFLAQTWLAREARVCSECTRYENKS